MKVRSYLVHVNQVLYSNTLQYKTLKTKWFHQNDLIYTYITIRVFRDELNRHLIYKLNNSKGEPVHITWQTNKYIWGVGNRFKHRIWHIVRCCIYLTTYDLITSFLKITIEGRTISGNLENKINTLYWPVENSICQVTSALCNLLLHNLTLTCPK